MAKKPGDLSFREALRQVHNRIVWLCLVLVCGFGLFQLHAHPKTPLPDAWNATRPLNVTDPETPLTPWKLGRALATPSACLEALATSSDFAPMDPLEISDNCHIRNQVRLRGLGSTRLAAVETSCAIALRSAMWVQHDLQPAAQDILGGGLERIEHLGSYNCRPIRTGSSNETRWSTHATAEALDVSGFRFGGGQQISLVRDWDGPGPKGAFLRFARDSACDWFRTTLGPEFNRLHADHFHLQSRGWGTCR